jgi:mannonate dehydratase
MQMTLRWYGSKYDTVTLKQIRQIPGVTGVISTLYGTAPGEVWEMDDILALKTEIEAAGLQLAGIESVNIHDAIKIGSPDREQYIENYITTLERLGQASIWYATISCRSLTGHAPNLPECVPTVLQSLLTIRLL